jgi:RimJ/RimL family protein N-acetyltransferase
MAEALLKDGRKVEVRPLEMADKDGVVALYSDLSPKVLRWALPPYDKVRVERFFGSPEQLMGVVGVAEGKLVGHLHIFRFVSRMSHVGELVIYLHQDYVNAGLGTLMMKAGLELAKAKGLRRVQLSVVDGNKNAIHLYGKLGFQREGERPSSYLGEDGIYHAAVEMGIVLK